MGDGKGGKNLPAELLRPETGEGCIETDLDKLYCLIEGHVVNTVAWYLDSRVSATEVVVLGPGEFKEWTLAISGNATG